jgi:hypothetical protein
MPDECQATRLPLTMTLTAIYVPDTSSTSMACHPEPQNGCDSCIHSTAWLQPLWYQMRHVYYQHRIMQGRQQLSVMD